MQVKYLVKTFHGLESVLVDEIIALGGEQVVAHNRAVSCVGSLSLGYRLNYFCRTAISVLRPLIQGRVRRESDLYELMQSICWHEQFDIKKTFLVRVVCYSDLFRNSHYLALKAKDAVVDQFRDKYQRRPSISKQPDVRIDLFIKHDDCVISLDLSGDSLFKRGYRLKTGDAPLNEVLAAGILKLSGWSGDQALVDPMCGAGTIPIEASLISSNRSPQFLRTEFGFQHYCDFDRRAWQNIMQTAEAVSERNTTIIGADKNTDVLRAARSNARNAGIQNIHWRSKNFFALEKPSDSGILIFNPPYDERIRINDAVDFYKKIGDQLKRHWTGWQALILSSHLRAIKHVGLKPTKKWILFNGPLECRLVQFELY